VSGGNRSRGDYVVELVGIEPTAGLPVTAMAASPWIAPQTYKANVPRLKWMLAFVFHTDITYKKILVESQALFSCIIILLYDMVIS
jgi:hypothetical protein